jgi:glycosyltransferase involved in cell wall biosynthesis
VIVGGSGTSYGAAPAPGTTWRQIFYNEVASRIDPQRVHFVGKLPHNVLTQLMQISSAHVYLTYPFVLSWSMMEAMSIGCLIVGSDTAPVREQITHGQNGILVDFFDPQALAEGVVHALENRADLHALRTAAREHIVARHDLASICLPAQLNLIARLGAATTPS